MVSQCIAAAREAVIAACENQSQCVFVLPESETHEPSLPYSGNFVRILFLWIIPGSHLYPCFHCILPRGQVAIQPFSQPFLRDRTRTSSQRHPIGVKQQRGQSSHDYALQEHFDFEIFVIVSLDVVFDNRKFLGILFGCAREESS